MDTTVGAITEEYLTALREFADCTLTEPPASSNVTHTEQFEVAEDGGLTYVSRTHIPPKGATETGYQAANTFTFALAAVCKMSESRARGIRDAAAEQLVESVMDAIVDK